MMMFSLLYKMLLFVLQRTWRVWRCEHAKFGVEVFLCAIYKLSFIHSPVFTIVHRRMAACTHAGMSVWRGVVVVYDAERGERSCFVINVLHLRLAPCLLSSFFWQSFKWFS